MKKLFDFDDRMTRAEIAALKRDERARMMRDLAAQKARPLPRMPKGTWWRKEGGGDD